MKKIPMQIAKTIIAFLKNSGEKIQNTHPAIQIGSFLVCAALLAVVFITLLFRPASTRAVFFFPETGTAKVRTEIRYLPAEHGLDSRIALYVGELLLGPMNHGYTALYDTDSRIVRCFTGNKALYVDISSEALESGTGSVPPDTAFSLFKKNVFTNFRNLDKIYLYINGIEVYSSNTYADAEQNIKKR